MDHSHHLDWLSKYNTIEFILEPLDGIFLLDLVAETDLGSADLSLGNTGSLSCQADEEVHSVNSGGRIVLDTQINVFVDSESEVSGLREVLLKEFVFLNLQSTLQNFEGLLSTDGNVNGDLLVTSDSETTKSVSGLGVDRLLSSQLFQHTGGTGQSITTLSDTAVQDQLVDLNLLHNIVLRFSHFDGFSILLRCDSKMLFDTNVKVAVCFARDKGFVFDARRPTFQRIGTACISCAKTF